MPKNNTQNLTKIVTDSGTGNDGVRHSNQDVSEVRGSQAASPEQLALALGLSEQANAAKDAKIAQLEAALAAKTSSQSAQNSDDSIVKLANAIVAATQAQAPSVPIDMDAVNRTTDFKSTRATVDGRSLMEAQQVLQSFRNENKKPISIPKSYANIFGPSLAITVNGVRVSIPCDGKTYYINETHVEHARERMAKVDIYSASDESQEVVIG